MWTKCAKFEYDDEGEAIGATLMPDDYQYEFYWDMATDTFTPKDEDVVLITNVAKDRVWYVDAFFNFNLSRPTDWSGTPKDPYNLLYVSAMDVFGYNAYRAVIPAVSTEGNLLDSNDLYYVVYIDGEPWTFDPQEYDIESPIEEVPWNLDTNNLWYAVEVGMRAMHCGKIFVEGFDTFGVQSVYKHEGVETRSNILTLDVATGEFVDPSAVEAVAYDKKVSDVKYFDLSGREVANPAAGIFVKRVTFEDGTVSTVKTAVR